MTATLPSLDAIQARADAARLCDYPGCDEVACQVRRDNAALVKVVRAMLDLHIPETPRRDPDFHHTDRVCIECGDPFPCRTYTAVTAHIDTTPKEKP